MTGTPRAGDEHLVLASVSGTSPGYPLGAHALPLNFDSIFLFSFEQANGAFFLQTFGTISPSGRSTAGFAIPPGMPAALVGVRFDLAYGTWDPTLPFALSSASNPVGVTLVK